MSALGDAVKARYNEDELIGLTRSGTDGSHTTVNDTILELAVDDVVGAMEVPHGITFDASEARHLSVACEGVILRLVLFGKASSRQARADWREWKTKDIELLAKHTRRARIDPKTSSPDVDTEPRPLDRERFDDYVISEPNLRSEDD